MRLHNLVKSTGRKPGGKKRLGRGEGSGLGKTSGRGHKGQRARAGWSQRLGFESGHIPLYRKLPKRGFNNKNFRTFYDIINLDVLEKLDTVTEFDRQALVDAGVLRKNGYPLKVLGNGEISRAVTVKAAKFSASAKDKIEKAGGQCVVEEAPAADSEPSSDASGE